MTKLGVLFSVLGVGAGCIPAFAQKQLPNIIVMLSDDQGWGDLGFTGNTFVQTPNIDRIAHEGTILENFYVCPVSSPTRAEFLTGRYHVRSGVNSTTGEASALIWERKRLRNISGRPDTLPLYLENGIVVRNIPTIRTQGALRSSMVFVPGIGGIIGTRCWNITERLFRARALS